MGDGSRNRGRRSLCFLVDLSETRSVSAGTTDLLNLKRVDSSQSIGQTAESTNFRSVAPLLGKLLLYFGKGEGFGCENLVSVLATVQTIGGL